MWLTGLKAPSNWLTCHKITPDCLTELVKQKFHQFRRCVTHSPYGMQALWPWPCWSRIRLFAYYSTNQHTKSEIMRMNHSEDMGKDKPLKIERLCKCNYSQWIISTEVERCWGSLRWLPEQTYDYKHIQKHQAKYSELVPFNLILPMSKSIQN